MWFPFLLGIVIALIIDYVIAKKNNKEYALNMKNEIIFETDNDLTYMENLYTTLRQTELTNKQVENMILNLDAKIRTSGAFARDQERWPEGTHADSCEELISYAIGRFEFLDKALYDFDYFEE